MGKDTNLLKHIETASSSLLCSWLGNSVQQLNVGININLTPSSKKNGGMKSPSLNVIPKTIPEALKLCRHDSGHVISQNTAKTQLLVTV